MPYFTDAMRLIGHLADETSARAFADYLYVQGIENQLEHDKSDGWGIWISDEDKIARANDLLSAFHQNPTDPKYTKEAKGAANLREQEQKDQETYQKRVRNRRHLFRPLTPYSFGPLTFILILISVVVFFLSHFGSNTDAVMKLFITDYMTEGDMIRWVGTLPEVRHGEIWRLITPIFIHMGPWHIIFNMLCLRDLGSMIEGRQSWVHLLILTLVIAACSNLAQFYKDGPAFGGMSGVIYGLLGYIWLRGKFDPASGLYLHPYTVTMMIVWFFVCFTGFLPVANTVHAVGLGMGMAWGYLSSLRYR
jgi:GlpG protein